MVIFDNFQRGLRLMAGGGLGESTSDFLEDGARGGGVGFESGVTRAGIVVQFPGFETTEKKAIKFQAMPEVAPDPASERPIVLRSINLAREVGQDRETLAEEFDVFREQARRSFLRTCLGMR